MNVIDSFLHKIPGRLWPWVWLGLAVVLYAPWIDTEPGQGNVATDLAAIESLVQRHTFFINDSTFANTLDKFYRDGLYFSQKSPIFHLVAAVPYAALHAMGFSLKTHTALCLRVLTLLMVILPMGWLLSLIFHHPWLQARSLRARTALTLLFALGSLATPMAVTLNHYILAAAFLMVAVNALTADAMRRAAGDKGTPGRRLGLLVGFAVSASLACDVPPAFLFGAGVGAVWLLRSPRRLAWMALGAAPLVLLYAALNMHIVGSPLPPNFYEEEMLYVEGSYWSELRDKALAGHPGFYQASYARRLLHATLGHKGIYWMMPLLAVGTLAAVWLVRRRAPGWPLALAWALYPPLAVVVTMRFAWDLSGGCYLIRHVLATLPPLVCVLAHPALPRVGLAPRRWLWPAALAGVLVAWIGVMNPWSHNTLSAIPPMENIARFCLNHPSRRLPIVWIVYLSATTSVTPDLAWLDLGQEFINRRQLPAAELALGKAIQADPMAGLPYYYLGIVQDMQDQPVLAIQTYEHLLELEPENVGAWNNMGTFCVHAGRLQEGRKAYDRSLELSPDNPSALWGQLLIDGMLGRADARSPKLREALRQYPNDPRLQSLARRWGYKPQEKP